MVDWVIASSSIAGMAVLLLEMLKEDGRSVSSNVGGLQHNGGVHSAWYDMSDAELDALVNTFCDPNAAEDRPWPVYLTSGL